MQRPIQILILHKFRQQYIVFEQGAPHKICFRLEYDLREFDSNLPRQVSQSPPQPLSFFILAQYLPCILCRVRLQSLDLDTGHRASAHA